MALVAVDQADAAQRVQTHAPHRTVTQGSGVRRFEGPDFRPIGPALHLGM
ncbi:MAG: hypothetical protein AAGE03_02055 [Pseudomonadota bacterium]